MCNQNIQTAEKLTFLFSLTVNDGDLECQAGAGWEDVNAYLQKRGLPYFSPVCVPHFLYTFDSYSSQLDPGPGAVRVIDNGYIS